MNAEEENQIEKLIGPSSNLCNHNAAIEWISNYLEEGDILNLPASTSSLDALAAYSKSKNADPVLKKKCEKLIKQYKR